ITNPVGAAITTQCGKKTTVILVDGTNNRLIDGPDYSSAVSGEDMKGTFFSEGQLVFEGTDYLAGNGNLEVRGKYKHVICSDDYFRLNSGNIVIKEAASDAVHANDYIRIDGGSIKTLSEGEGLECEKGYVVINGGDIQLTTTGEKGHGIKSKEYLTVTDGTITILVSGTASKGINVTEDIDIRGGTIHITTTGDAYFDEQDNDTSSCAAIKCDGDMRIENGTIVTYSSGSGGKGLNVGGALTIEDGRITVTTTGDQYVYDRNHDTAAKAIKSTGNLTVNGGTITIRTSKTEAEGLESKATLTINGGDLDIRAYDDCINASDHIEITGGNIYCYSESNDGVDSNGTLTISGGMIVSVGAGSPEDGFDCDQNRFTITGGVAVGIGGSTSTPTASACTQHSVIYRGSQFSILRIEKSADSSEVLTFRLPRTYHSTTVLVTTPALQANTGYTIYTGGTISGGTDFHGYYTGAAYTKGSSAGTFTTGSMVSTVGSSGGTFPGGR
ncbi:MAG: carbohydrate-binding domain-containing protein, partial [Rikenellaceae bacterium]|nr:carbohydrate-binding domain-containing protein [Rikenellaceae bacterium]